MTNMLTPLN